ncbi:MAG TPA: ATP-binding protein [Solirubrobacteraceae bacterium]|nr:ATP-binding protein [Solirubrobacteraceae bacterium]
MSVAALTGWASARVEGRSPADPSHAVLDALSRTFRLSRFERAVLTLCAAVELDDAFARRVTATFGLALRILPDPHWSALAPWAPLRHWRLIDVAAGQALTSAALRVDERILCLLAGVDGMDPRVAACVRPLTAPVDALPALAAAADATARAIESGGPWPVVQLVGERPSELESVAAMACARLGLRAHVVSAAGELPDRRLWEREAALSGAVLVVALEDAGAVRRFADGLLAPLVVAGRAPVASLRDALRLEVAPPSASERRARWRSALGAEAAASLDGQLDAIAGQFELDAVQVRAAGREALAGDPAGTLGDRLWRACRSRSRPPLDDLAQRIVADASWDDLVLPEAERTTLLQIAAQVRRRTTVYEDWGFGRRGARGLGITAMFAGDSGTGKTLAAEVLACELGLDLFRIDLSSVVSKYIGETEKNLRRVFEAAEQGSAVLLFDEADALFGKRTEVRDSHDRFANIEVSYLLQRMEAYRGLAILTTNQREALDTAFLRRIRFVVEFPFPGPAERAAIWRRAFPPPAPLDGIDPEALAALTIPGGTIRNVALGAAFLAADEERPVRMADVLRAARTEYAKLERRLDAHEIHDLVEA